VASATFADEVTLSLVVSGSIGGVAEGTFETAFVEKQTAESTKVIQDAPAGGHVGGQFRKIEVDELESFFAAVGAIRACQRDISLYFGECLANGIGQEADILLGTLDVIERSLGTVTTHSADLFIAISSGFASV
jgi:hypothetical protein